jgi:hypothetical protein
MAAAINKLKLDTTTTTTATTTPISNSNSNINSNINSKKDDNNDNDDLSSLGDSSPMREAESRQRQRVQKAHQRLRQVVMAMVAIVYVLFQLSSINPKSALQAISKPFDEVVQSKTQLQHLRQEHLAKVALTVSKFYKPTSPNVWCIDGRLKYEQGKRRSMGLCYLKLPRAASSFLAGINQRIARNFAKRQGLTKSCIRHDGHVPGMFYSKRDPLSFLWTFVRDPADRALSRVAHALSKVQGGSAAGANVSTYTIQALHANADLQYGAVSAGRGGFQLQYAMLRMIEEGSAWNSSDPTTVQNPPQVQQNVFSVIDAYDFVGVVERMDESLVAMQLLLGLEATDILQFPTKTHLQYERRSVKTRPNALFCQQGIDPNDLREPPVKHYLESSEWFAQNYGDYLLHRAASMSLDRTILKIGLPEFAKALKAYRALKKQADETCRPIFSCSEDGTDQSTAAENDCYDGDHIGCGYLCLDSMKIPTPTE